MPPGTRLGRGIWWWTMSATCPCALARLGGGVGGVGGAHVFRAHGLWPCADSRQAAFQMVHVGGCVAPCRETELIWIRFVCEAGVGRVFWASLCSGDPGWGGQPISLQGIFGKKWNSPQPRVMVMLFVRQVPLAQDRLVLQDEDGSQILCRRWLKSAMSKVV